MKLSPRSLNASLAAAAGLLAFMSVPANADTFNVQCPANALAAAGAFGGAEKVSTTSVDFVDLPGLTTTIDNKGNGDCIVVNVTAVTKVTAGTRLFVRALLDGTVKSQPPQIRIQGTDSTKFQTGAGILIFSGVPSGTHTVTIQWKSTAGTEVFALNRTLQVSYKGQ